MSVLLYPVQKSELSCDDYVVKMNGSEVAPDAARFPKDLPPDAVFGIRFRSDIPIVVTHKTYSAAYFGEGLG